eukprot:11185115-Lingulodinium_polyedra.AAC.1
MGPMHSFAARGSVWTRSPERTCHRERLGPLQTIAPADPENAGRRWAGGFEAKGRGSNGAHHCPPR